METDSREARLYAVYRISWAKELSTASISAPAAEMWTKKTPHGGGVAELVQWLTSADKIPFIIAKNAPPHQLVTGRF